MFWKQMLLALSCYMICSLPSRDRNRAKHFTFCTSWAFLQYIYNFCWQDHFYTALPYFWRFDSFACLFGLAGTIKKGLQSNKLVDGGWLKSAHKRYRVFVISPCTQVCLHELMIVTLYCAWKIPMFLSMDQIVSIDVGVRVERTKRTCHQLLTV